MNIPNLSTLPIDACLAELKAALQESNSAILVAPPGAGKTTRVPLALLNEKWLENKKIIMLEPRRIAARSAANFMASLLGEKAGQTIGYRVRMDTKVSSTTKIEVVTEGVYTRMVLDDPELKNIGAVLFDEYHERSLEADLGLALTLDVQSALRPDLRILPMSATLDGARVADLFEDAKLIKSEGRAYDIVIKHENKMPDEHVVDAMARAIVKAHSSEHGSILCFLPGMGEIKRLHDKMQNKLPATTHIVPLHGSLNPRDQDKAIQPANAGERKVVLATTIAQTSITIEDVRVVIDSGLVRVPVYEPNIGITRLETHRAAKASIDQRAGRAGRTQEGVVYRLWHEGQTNALPAYEQPEILSADLSSLVLDLAEWGVSDPSTLNWLNEPPKAAWHEAVKTLNQLGALNESGAITPKGSKIRSIALPSRLANMVLHAGEKFDQAKEAALLAMLLSERGLGGQSKDLNVRLNNLKRDKSARAKKHIDLAHNLAKSIKPMPPTNALSCGALLSFAYPDRIAKNMGSDEHGQSLFRMENGRRAKLDGQDSFANSKFITIAEVQGKAASAHVFAASEILREEIDTLYKDDILKTRKIEFDKQSKQFKARETLCYKSLELSSQPSKLLSDDNITAAMLDVIKKDGLGILNFDKAEAGAYLKRLQFLHAHMPGTFAMINHEILIEKLDDWLAPFITTQKNFDQIKPQNLLDGLQHLIGYELAQQVEKLAPKIYKSEMGSNIALDYASEHVTLSVRVQELFGLNTHPTILNGQYNLQVELLSPAQRPIQKTNDLVGFWAGSWNDVKKEMKGRYPKHIWPADPANSKPTLRAKARKT
ncbi:MAG: ATP-dependent helicase HrpB [Nitratireductor sp.]